MTQTNRRCIGIVAVAIVGNVLYGTLATAQWLTVKTPGIPRTADGKPNLTAPAPRTSDGKPDLSGVWQMVLGVAYTSNIVADLTPEEILPWADALFRRRMADLGKDDSSLVGCLPRGPRHILGSAAGPAYIKVVQAPGLITVLYEDLAYRQIFTDGRALPPDPNPSFMGYSVGRWEGDTLIVDSIGFNDRTWLDFGGHPHTEALRITERFRRVDVGRIDLEVTLEDRGAYTRPWTVPVSLTLSPDTDLLEYVCNENEQRRTSLVGRSDAEKSLVIPVETLSDYVGTYVIDAGRRDRVPVKVLSVRMRDGVLLLDLDGKGSLPLMALSPTSFSTRLVNVEFVRNERGQVTQAVNPQTGARYVRQP